MHRVPCQDRRREALRGAPLLAAGSWPQPADAMPAHFNAFDVLPVDGQELLAEPYESHRAALEVLFRERGLSPPWTLCPMSTDPAVASLEM
ncbi:hypothetical protein ACF1G0_22350 [Streptomyces sp. NPDC013953]|uniref:hypothetical protein n=1 Tax=Streptomyces sp. NPDC013953 TaxID=3364868 RepID=UPI003700F3E7